MRIGLLEIQTDLSPAGWVADVIHPLGQDVGSLVPEGFEAYARIFHPAEYVVPGTERPVRWAEIAATNGRRVHPEMQFPHLTGRWPHRDSSKGDPLWNCEPDEGCLPRDHSAALAAVLAPFTTTPDPCWFCVWDGFGGSKLPYAQKHKMQLPQRTYHLLKGPIEGINETFHQPAQSEHTRSSQQLRRRWFRYRPVGPPERGWRGIDPVAPPSGTPTSEFWQSANLWWPDDRAWFVATEIDLMSTYVGGSRECIDALLAAPKLEVLEAQIGDGIGYESDRINPPPDEPITSN